MMSQNMRFYSLTNMNLVFVICMSLVLLCLGHQSVSLGAKEDDEYKCFDKERQALLDFKAHLHDHEGRLDTWAPAEEGDCCKWSGVICNNQTGHVLKLHLIGFTISGEVSSSLLNLTYLYHLHLDFYHFNGTMPGFIASMTQLKYLQLSTSPLFRSMLSFIDFTDGLVYNDFQGTVLPEFGNLTNLRYLSLEYIGRNCTVENIDWLSRLSHLEYLSLAGISLAKANHWVNVILGLQNLTYLSLSDCDLSQVMHPYSSSFLSTSSSSSIATLDLSSNNLNSSIYHWLFLLTSNSLVTLYLDDNNLDHIPKYLGDLCSLEQLSLYDNSLAVEFSNLLKNLSGCTSETLESLLLQRNQLTGSLPDEIQKFSSLRWLDLSYNRLNGNISEKVWRLPKLESIDVRSNSLGGHVLFENIGESNVSHIYLSNNSLEVIPPSINMPNLSFIEYIDLSSCKLGPSFPKWIQTLTNITILDISNTRIADTVPMMFWKTWPSQLICLNLSSNNINGKVPNLLSNLNLRQSVEIDLSNNSFHGPIPSVPKSLAILNLSRNKFNGGLSFLCQITDGFLVFLDLSHNSLTGQLPDCLWLFKNLRVLNLGHNKLSGRLPATIGNLVQLEVLYLYNNDFSGYLPLSLQNCTRLNFLDLGSNHFIGNVPIWIGENLLGLYVLSLRSNNFFGAIPSKFCRLQNLQVLDLSINSLYGTIPSCLNNLTTMVQEGFSEKSNVHELSVMTYKKGNAWAINFFGTYVDYAMIEWQGNEQEFYRNNFRLMRIINLACNNLSGQIPNELVDLHELLGLNLSMNALLGEIPQKIGLMRKLLVLDLSVNDFSGGLPSSMCELTSLGYLDVSNNNLSGRIPLCTPLQSVEPPRYNGNIELCGLPIAKSCKADNELATTVVTGESVDNGEGKDELQRWFYIGGATGFTIGFWIACSWLLLYCHGRHGFLSFS